MEDLRRRRRKLFQARDRVVSFLRIRRKRLKKRKRKRKRKKENREGKEGKKGAEKKRVNFYAICKFE